MMAPTQELPMMAPTQDLPMMAPTQELPMMAPTQDLPMIAPTQVSSGEPSFSQVATNKSVRLQEGGMCRNIATHKSICDAHGSLPCGRCHECRHVVHQSRADAVDCPSCKLVVMLLLKDKYQPRYE